ncbi:pectin acetylesterase 7-like [Iris pallida]|uniref:Pectin acetylesterase n=1 Tax=Iris pallida TaxID=29817 RepID=A0AAX6E684_IRIPA|nr:pectin acetylesterase 7-like [Iris pallida]KAJ6846317.1 pectin acetylesterase 7-like [Iris pallida]
MMDLKPAMRISSLILVVYLVVLLNLEVNAYPVPMTLLSNAAAKGAVCLDGSPPAYHFSPGFGSGANNWLVHMEGGGWCRSTAECLARRDTFRGSSTKMKQMSFSGILGNQQNSNPDFYNWNKVKVRYCDGSSFTGDVESVDPKTKLYYRGARIWQAIMDELLAKGMKNAANALLSGCSAGGLASILHCDKFRGLLPGSANVKCFSDAGYFINAKDVSGADHIQGFFGQVVATHGSAKNLPSSCTSKFSPTLCFFPQYVVPEMSTPLFVLNAAYDSWQIKNILTPTSANSDWNECKLDIKKCSTSQLAALQGYRSEFLSVLPGRRSSTGMFIISCYAHCQSGSKATWSGNGSPAIGDSSIGKAVGDWFYGRRVVQLIDCQYPCNKSCANTIDE